MPLILPWSKGQGSVNNLLASPGSLLGTTVTASGSTHTKGSWTQLLAAASVTEPAFGFWVVISSSGLANNQRNNLVDIGIGGSGSEVVIVSNLPTTVGNSPAQQPGSGCYYFPIFIPAGTRIAARCQSNAASQTMGVTVWLDHGHGIPPHATFSGAECINADTTTSRVTDMPTGAAAGVESAWTNCGSTTSKNYGAIMVAPAMGNVASYTVNLICHVEWGWNSTTYGEVVCATNNTELVGNIFPAGPQRVLVPSGTQLQARIECSNTAEAVGIGLIGFF